MMNEEAPAATTLAMDPMNAAEIAPTSDATRQRDVESDGYFHGGQMVGSGTGDDSTQDLIFDITIGVDQHLVEYNFCKTRSSTCGLMPIE